MAVMIYHKTSLKISDYLGNIVINFGEEFFQMLGVVVLEDVLGHATILDPLDHGGVVTSVGENLAT